MKQVVLLVLGVVGVSMSLTEAFSCRTTDSRSTVSVAHSAPSSTRLFAKKDNKPPPPDFLFQDFKTANGEVLDPYKVLKVKETATVDEIKQSYRQLSRKYHADANRFKDVLPGRCNNKEEVRDEWERIKLAYEILRDPKLRLRYDRNVVIADPGAAMQRAALNAVGKSLQGVGQAMGKGLFGMGKGLLDVGAFTVEQLTSKQQEEANREQSTAGSIDNNENDIKAPVAESALEPTKQSTSPTSETRKESPLNVEM